MKKLILILTILSNQAFAQTKDNLSDVLNQMRQTDLFKQCLAFKTQLESQAKEASKNKLSEKQAYQLQRGYVDVLKKYDFFLKSMKQDVINNENLSSKVDATTNKYMLMLKEVRAEYNTKFLPTYNSVVGGKGIVEDILNIGIGLVKNLVNKIKAKIPDKNQILNNILPQINKYVFGDLGLKTWTELNIPKPSIAIDSSSSKNEVLPILQPVAIDSNSSKNEVLVITQPNSENTTKPQEVVTEVQIPSTPPSTIIDIPAATLGEMTGNISFIQLNNQKELPMEFEQKNGKDIVVETGTNSNLVYKTPYFTSIQNFPIGTKFKLLADATVFIYVIVLNTNGIALLHPYVKYAQTGKDIEVTLAGSPTNGKFTLPEKGAFTIVPAKTGTESTSEDFALVISKSELVMEDTIEKLNAATGQLDERFSQVFADQQITYDEAQVILSGGQLNFSYLKGDKNILPIVFKINK